MVLLAMTTTAAGQLRPLAPETLFITPQEQAVLTFKADGKLKTLQYVLADYWERPVAGPRAAAVKNGLVTVPVSLPRGYYQISFPQVQQTFGVVALEAAAGPRDALFCIDAAMSWLVRDEKRRPPLVKVLSRCGVGLARERLWWGSVSGAGGKFDWQGDRGYQRVRQLYRDAGLRVLELFHDGPAWMGRLPGSPYPTDLVAAAQSWREISKHWDPFWGGIEIWNEPDISFGGNLPADQYVPLVKAVSYGLAAAGGKAPVGGGVFTDAVGLPMLTACGDSRMLDYVDFVSCHNYGTAATVEGQVAAYRAWLGSYGKASLPLWISECGWPWRRGPGRAPTGEAQASALEIVAKAVEARACGVARQFPFVYPFYEERAKSFGMMGKAGTPLRAMAAYAQCVLALSHKKYVGDLKAGGAGIRRARVFSDGTTAVAVLYSGSPKAKAAVKLKLPAAARLAGIDGRELSARQDGAVPLPDGLTYVYMSAAQAAKLIRRDTAAARLYAISRKPPPKRAAPAPIILQYLPDLKQVRATSLGYHAGVEQAATFPLRIRVNNLSDARAAVQLSLVATPADRYAKTVEPAAEGFAEASWSVDLRKHGAGPVKKLTVRAVSESRVVLDVLRIRVSLEQTLAEHLAGFAVRQRLPITELKRWKKNVTADGRMSMSATPGGHWLLTVQFGKQDPWVYPMFTLPTKAGLAGAAGVVIRAKCGRPGTVRLIFREKNRSTYFTNFAAIPADGKWHAALIRMADLAPLPHAGPPDANGKLDLDEVDTIMVGLNSKAKENALEVSDLYVVKHH